MKVKRYAIVHEGEKTTWMKPVDRGFDLVEKFCTGCIIDKFEADRFLGIRGLDPRYKLRILDITISKPKD